jgi:hypothetical protein
MKNLLIYYRAVSYIIIVIAGLFAFVDLFSILVALSNPAVLINIFILTAVIIYSFASFVFLTKGIQKKQQCKASLKDWIKVNAYVAVVFGLLALVQGVLFFASPASMADAVKQVNMMMEKTNQPGASAQMVISMMKSMLFCMIIYAALLLSHVFITLRLVKDYAALFGEAQSGE